MATVSKQQQEYLKFRRVYRRLITAAKREMTTDMQRNMVDAIAVTAFTAGYRAPRNTPDAPVKLRKWRGRNDPQ